MDVRRQDERAFQTALVRNGAVWISIIEAAQHVGMHPATLTKRLHAEPNIQIQRIGRMRFIKEEDIPKLRGLRERRRVTETAPRERPIGIARRLFAREENYV